MRAKVGKVVRAVRARPRTAVLAGVAVALGLALAASSCQSTGPTGRASRDRGPALRGGVAMAGEPDIRVRIAADVDQVELSGPARLVVRPDGGAPATLATPLLVSARADGLRVLDAGGSTLRLGRGAAAEVVGADGAMGPISVNGTPYGGRLRIVPREAAPEGGGAERAADVRWPDEAGGGSAAATLDVIETLPLERYLPGVLAKELPHTWPLGAFQVQAVCARTYALHQRERARDRGRAYDVESTVADQAYAGATQHPAAIRAAADTRGVVLTWAGGFLRAYYSSTCGGRTASAADIWPTAGEWAFNLAAPIQAHRREHACTDSPVYTWETTRTREELTERLREWGRANGSPVKGMGTVAGVEVESVNAVGRPVRFRLTDAAGKSYSLSSEQLRMACNAPAKGLAAITGSSRVRSGDLEMSFAGSVVTIRGRGFGHGVGMCQYCTRAMAARGDGWREMLGRFYPGAGVERAY